MKTYIPEVKQRKGKVIPEAISGVPKFTSQEKATIKEAIDKIVVAYYSIWEGIPVRKVEDIKKELTEAKQALAQIKCPQVI
jgi:hypothetical protein